MSPIIEGIVIFIFAILGEYGYCSHLILFFRDMACSCQLGMHAFAGIRQSDQYYLNQDTNFEDFPTAFITLIRGMTGENWNGIMVRSFRAQEAA